MIKAIYPKEFSFAKLLKTLMRLQVLNEATYSEVWGDKQMSWNPFTDIDKL